MGKSREILRLSILIMIISLSLADIFYDIERQEDPCINRCKEAPIPNVKKDLDPEEKKYVATCCERGCRFYNLVNVHLTMAPYNFNCTLEACDASCKEAYPVLQDLSACRVGCILMAEPRVREVLTLAIQIQNTGYDPSIFLSPPVVENDIINDPGLEKELMPRWWGSDGFKLPETYFKSIPIDSGSVDYTISSEYIEEREKTTSITISLPGSDWLQCASRHTGIPRWILAFAIVAAALSALWLCLSPEKSDSIDKVTLVQPDPDKVTVYLPDEAPLYKKPPPKYSEMVPTIDIDLQV